MIIFVIFSLIVVIILSKNKFHKQPKEKIIIDYFFQDNENDVLFYGIEENTLLIWIN